MLKNILIIICLTLFVISVMQYRNQMSTELGYKQQIAYLKNTQQRVVFDNVLLSQNIEQQTMSENLSLAGDASVVFSNKKTTLKSFFGDSKKLVLRLPPSICGLCYDSAFMIFESWIEKIGSKNILVLVHPDKLRETKKDFYRKKINIDVASLDIPLDLLVDKGLSPYFFVTDNALISHHIFIIQKDDKILINKYLNHLLYHYFNIYHSKVK